MVKPAGCVFCPIEGEKVPGRRALPEWPHVTSHVTRYGAELVPGIVFAVFEPLNPVTPGHLLVVPEKHVEHAKADPQIAAGAMEVAATIAARYKAANLITSIGAAATQTVHHLHVHMVPRHAGDGLHLPWTPAEPVTAAPAPLPCTCGGVLPCIADTLTGPWCDACRSHHVGDTCRATGPRPPVTKDTTTYEIPQDVLDAMAEGQVRDTLIDVPKPSRFTTGVPIGGPA